MYQVVWENEEKSKMWDLLTLHQSWEFWDFEVWNQRQRWEGANQEKATSFSLSTKLPYVPAFPRLKRLDQWSCHAIPSQVVAIKDLTAPPPSSFELLPSTTLSDNNRHFNFTSTFLKFIQRFIHPSYYLIHLFNQSTRCLQSPQHPRRRQLQLTMPAIKVR